MLSSIISNSMTPLVWLLLTAMLGCFVSAGDPTVDFENPVRSQDQDLIQQLPGLHDPVNFRQYSGYLNADDSDKPSKFLHYWFVESQNNPEKDPLLLWLNGGPGCSSLMGFFTELGPFSINNDGKTLSLRKSPWNKNANVIFLESPTGVGFSYSTKRAVLDDNTTARQNHLALKSFLNKFPQYKNRSLYISGESYGGVYLPTLGVLLDEDSSINFKGIAIGNGYLDAGKLGRTLIFFSYYHGLYGKSTWDRVSKHCCNNSPPSYNSCDFKGFGCKAAVEEATDKILSSGINPYNYAADCEHPPTSHMLNKNFDKRLYAHSSVTRTLMKMSLNFTSESNQLFKVLGSGRVSDLSEEPPCSDDTASIEYLDSSEVQKAIHVPTHLKSWAGPCAQVNYAMIYPQREGGLAPQMQKLIDSKRNLSILIYNGDLDMMCNFYGDEQFSDDLGRPVKVDYSQWHVNGQVAGYFKTYKGFTFATIKGAGHMVPTDKEAEALSMITRWLLK